jgi:hypothetical protein
VSGARSAVTVSLQGFARLAILCRDHVDRWAMKQNLRGPSCSVFCASRGVDGLPPRSSAVRLVYVRPWRVSSTNSVSVTDHFRYCQHEVEGFGIEETRRGDRRSIYVSPTWLALINQNRVSLVRRRVVVRSCSTRIQTFFRLGSTCIPGKPAT